MKLLNIVDFFLSSSWSDERFYKGNVGTVFMLFSFLLFLLCYFLSLRASVGVGCDGGCSQNYIYIYMIITI